VLVQFRKSQIHLKKSKVLCSRKIMSRRERIAEILQKRQPLSKKIDEVCGHAHNLISALQSFDGFIEEYERFAEIYSEGNKGADVEKAITADNQRVLNSELENLRYLHERFARPPLKIAVAGLPKEGKSELIRAITSLPKGVIPSSQHLCTGAPYTVYNHESDETFGWVTFYSSSEFLEEVIHPYYDDPDLKIPDKPSSLNTWKKPELQASEGNAANDGDAVKETKYKRLLTYFEFYPDYKDYLDRQPEKAEKSKIRQYIAQISEDEEEIHIYRAVKSAEIYTKFPDQNVGQIALVDTPGVGELRSQEEEKLVEMLRKNADIVICVILPRSNEYTYQARHANFFRLMQKGIGKADKRCLLVLNDDGKNGGTCNELVKKEKLEQWALKFAKVFITNCSQAEQVGNAVVDPTLDYLAEQIESFDQSDVSSSFRIILEQVDKISSFLGGIFVEPSDNISYISSRKYRELFEKTFIPSLRAALKLMRISFAEKHEDLSVKKMVKDRLASLTFSVPSAEVIESRRNPKDTYDPVFEEALGQLRVQALQHFQNLDLEFKPVADELRRIVANELRNINLTALSPKDGSNFLEALYHLMPESCQMLRLAFRVLREFELSYFWLIRAKLYQGLKVLTPAENSFKPKSSDSTKTVTAQTVSSALDESCKAVKSDLLGLLGGDAADDLFPSVAVLAVLEEFTDLVFYAGDEEGRGVILSEWQDFLEPFKAKIWVQDFQKLEEEIELKERGTKIIEQARSSIIRLKQYCDLEEVL